MLWLLVTLLAYLILAMVGLGDRYLLSGPMASPKTYSFYVGGMNILVLALIPFVGFAIPAVDQIVLAFSAGALFVLGLFWFYKAASLFEVSRVAPAIGAILPVFTFLLIFIFSKGKEAVSFLDFLSFVLLVAGSFLITFQKNKKISFGVWKMSLAAAFFIALFFVLSKYVYLQLPFWQGFIWMKLGGFLAAVCFLFSPIVRKELFKQQPGSSKKTTGLFLINQAAGAGGNVLQNWGIALAPLAFVPFINALQGVQYVFLLAFILLISLKFPYLLKEEIAKGVILQKVIAILVIGAGLTILALK